mmetsp:Transcript_29626/g.62998  ORF Transcript_29626/g.62998 Transcript_29626/m.62998 type:complete len:99 (+) Transcript_29626:2-298(+)
MHSVKLTSKVCCSSRCFALVSFLCTTPSTFTFYRQKKRPTRLLLALSLFVHSYSLPPQSSSRTLMVSDLGLSMGSPSALSQTPWLSTPRQRETPKSTV